MQSIGKCLHIIHAYIGLPSGILVDVYTSASCVEASMKLIYIYNYMYDLLQVTFITSQFNLRETLVRLNATKKDCSPGYLLQGDVCSNELSTLQMNCLASGPSDEVMVTKKNQNELQLYLIIVLEFGLSHFNLSAQCDVILRSFVCLYSYGLCEGNKTRLLSRESCKMVRDVICVREWSDIINLVGTDGLPLCEDFPAETEQCEG